MHSREEERSGEVERKQTDGDRGVKEKEKEKTQGLLTAPMEGRRRQMHSLASRK